MKLSRWNKVLALCLLALVALDLTTWPREAASRPVEALFVPWEPGAVSTIRVDQGEQSDFAGDGSLVVRRDEMGVFRLPDHFGYPARERAVAFLIDSVASLNTLDLLSEDPASHRTYGLTLDQAVRIRLEDAAGRVLADLLQGNRAPGGRAYYVRRADSDQVYRAPNFAREAVRGSLLVWIESRWCTLDSDLVQRIVWTGPEATDSIELTRQVGSRTVWSDAQGREVVGNRVTQFLRALSLVTIKDVQGISPVGPDSNGGRFTLRVEQAGGAIWTGHWGPEAP
ncbi:MAG: DUF4340 domain-containing protein, partial [Planctomycetes bacterium]|nr:DUF4340 domain-containing protein [Planctomycetota bacterium]